MNLYLFRRELDPTFTIGHIYDGVRRLCDTLEDPVRDLKDLNGDGDFNDLGEGKIYGNTAIPAGKYELKMMHSPSFKRLMPYLQGVPGFTSVMIHAGNTTADTKGCVLVGINRRRGKLTDSRGWSDIINDMLIKAEAKGEVNYLYICQD
jgi:hypothetical protein